MKLLPSLLLALTSLASAQDWPQWRGPLANGFSPTAQPPVRWSETQNVRWKIALPGKGHGGAMEAGYRRAAGWLAGRLAGEPARSNCR